MVTFRGRLAKVSCTENVSVIHRYLPTDVRRCIHTHRNCFGNLPLPTDACHQMYEHAPKMFQSFTIPYRGMPGGVSYPPKLFPKFTVTFRGGQAKVSVCTENVSVIYHSLLMQARRCIHTHRNYFDNLW